MTHHILPGSIEVDDGIAQAGVHTGPNEWTPQNLRYVRAKVPLAAKDETIQAFFARVYDNSEGCLLKGDFKMKEAG